MVFLEIPAGNFIKKDTMAQVFSCQFFEISKNMFPYRTTSVAASENNEICFKFSTFGFSKLFYQLNPDVKCCR